MSDHDDNRGEEPEENLESAPIHELADLEIDVSPELEGRVKRDINRRTLTADSLDFSFTVMLQIFWEHLCTAIESWPGQQPETPPAKD